MHTTHQLAARILDAAEEIVIGDGVAPLGYGTIAERLGVSRDEVRAAFPVFEQLLGALMFRMSSSLVHYVADSVERDPLGGLPSRIYGYALSAIFESPLARALYFADPGGLKTAFSAVDGIGPLPDLSIDSQLLPALQEAGMARRDVDPVALAAMLTAIGAGASLTASNGHLHHIVDTLLMLLERSVDTPGVTNTSPGKLVAQRFTAIILAAEPGR